MRRYTSPQEQQGRTWARVDNRVQASPPCSVQVARFFIASSLHLTQENLAYNITYSIICLCTVIDR